MTRFLLLCVPPSYPSVVAAAFECAKHLASFRTETDATWHPTVAPWTVTTVAAPVFLALSILVVTILALHFWVTPAVRACCAARRSRLTQGAKTKQSNAPATRPVALTRFWMSTVAGIDGTLADALLNAGSGQALPLPPVVWMTPFDQALAVRRLVIGLVTLASTSLVPELDFWAALVWTALCAVLFIVHSTIASEALATLDRPDLASGAAPCQTATGAPTWHRCIKWLSHITSSVLMLECLMCAIASAWGSFAPLFVFQTAPGPVVIVWIMWSIIFVLSYIPPIGFYLLAVLSAWVECSSEPQG